jgi:hypothetical protein
MPRRSPPPDADAPEYEAILDPAEHAPEPGPDGLAPELELTPPDVVKRTKPPREKKTLSRATAVKAGQQVLTTSHTILAKGLDEPALALSPEEAKKLSEVGIDLLEAYGVSLTTNPKAAAWISFLTVWAEHEIPRVIIMVRRPPKRRKAAEPIGEAPPIILPTTEEVAS